MKRSFQKRGMGMLKLEHLSWGTPDGEEIIKHLNLTIENGKLIVVTGPNGGGKTTLAKLIAGIQPASSGKIWMDCEELTGLDVT